MVLALLLPEGSSDPPGLTPRVVFPGEAARDVMGAAVAGAGDVNGDGFDDVLVGAWAHDSGGEDAGRAYLFLGGPDLDDVPDWIGTGSGPGDHFGTAVTGLGDLNGDGYDEFAVSAPFHDGAGTDAGWVAIYAGGERISTDPFQVIPGRAPGEYFGSSLASLSRPDGSPLLVVGAQGNDAAGEDAGAVYLLQAGASPIRVTGEVGGEAFGAAVAGVGDVDGDGFEDLLVGAPRSPARGPGSGRAYLFLSGDTRRTASLALTGESEGEAFGAAVAGADLDRDGLADLVIGAPGGSERKGRLYVFLGGRHPDPLADRIVSGRERDAQLGRAVACADLDGDGVPEIVVGAPYANTVVARGGAWFRTGLGDTALHLAAPGDGPGELLGWPLARAGDIDGDGRDEVVAGAQGFTGAGSSSGRAVVFDGTSAATGRLHPPVVGRRSRGWTAVVDAPRRARVTVELLDVRGRVVAGPVRSDFSTGATRLLPFEDRPSPGRYVIRARTSDRTRARPVWFPGSAP